MLDLWSEQTSTEQNRVWQVRSSSYWRSATMASNSGWLERHRQSWGSDESATSTSRNISDRLYWRRFSRTDSSRRRHFWPTRLDLPDMTPQRAWLSTHKRTPCHTQRNMSDRLYWCGRHEGTTSDLHNLTYLARHHDTHTCYGAVELTARQSDSLGCGVARM